MSPAGLGALADVAVQIGGNLLVLPRCFFLPILFAVRVLTVLVVVAAGSFTVKILQYMQDLGRVVPPCLTSRRSLRHSRAASGERPRPAAEGAGSGCLIGSTRAIRLVNSYLGKPMT
jgi:hypothetical protein